jgi:mRNA-degrading endonuclease YafQ of YafQ-DinJ toxin-antitoxin module
VTTGERNPAGTARKLGTLLMEVVNLLAADTPLPPGISIIHYPANGRITVIVTSGRISFSSTASPIRTSLELVRLGSHSQLGM